MTGADTDFDLERAPDRSLVLVRQGRRTRVQPRRCFPWREPGRFISLADDQGREQALVRDPADLPASSRQALAGALADAGFTLEIRRILSVDKEIEIRHWRVDVGGRVRTFQTELDEWPRHLSGGALLIRDVAGDLYTIRDPERLDERSRRFLWSLT
jgi:hypothetical protein